MLRQRRLTLRSDTFVTAGELRSAHAAVMADSESTWSTNPHYGIADGPSEYNFTHTTSTGLQFQCFVHDISSRPTLSSDNKIGIVIAMSANAVIPMALNLQKCASSPLALHAALRRRRSAAALAAALRSRRRLRSGASLSLSPSSLSPSSLSLSLSLSQASGPGPARPPRSSDARRYAHLKNTGPDGEPIKHFTRIPLWWLGIIGMIAGEFFNLLAYGYAPTAIVAPVGAVGVFFNGIIATVFVKETFTRWHALGLVAIAVGVVMVVSSVPEVQLDLTSSLLWTYVLPDPRFWVYTVVLCAFVPCWMKLVVPLHAKRHVLVYLLLCAAISSATVVASRAFSSMLTDALANGHWLELVHPISLSSLVVIAFTAVASTAYLNKAMMHFGNNEVVPVYYTTFTLASVGAGAVVYSEFSCLDVVHTVLFMFGCLFTFAGVYLVASGRGDAKTDKFKGGKRLMDGPEGGSVGPSSSCDCGQGGIGGDASGTQGVSLSAAGGGGGGGGGGAGGGGAQGAELARVEPDLPWAGNMAGNGNGAWAMSGLNGLNGVQLRKHGMDTNSMTMGALGKAGTFTVAGVILEEAGNTLKRRNSGSVRGDGGDGGGSPSRKTTGDAALKKIQELTPPLIEGGSEAAANGVAGGSGSGGSVAPDVELASNGVGGSSNGGHHRNGHSCTASPAKPPQPTGEPAAPPHNGNGIHHVNGDSEIQIEPPDGDEELGRLPGLRV